MKPARFPLLHHWLFWLGLLPVVVLLWAWSDSLYCGTSWYCCRDGQRATSFELWASTLEAGSYTITPRYGHQGEAVPPGVHLTSTGPWGRWTRERGAAFGEYRYFPPPNHKTERFPLTASHMRVGSIRIIPLWLLVAIWLPLWLGLAEWQAWRKERKQREAERALERDA